MSIPFLPSSPFKWSDVRDRLSRLISSANQYVRPEDFGSVGAGGYTDTAAVQAAFASGFPVDLGSRTYYCQPDALTIGQNKSGLPRTLHDVVRGSGRARLVFPETAGVCVRVIHPRVNLSGFSIECDKPDLGSYTEDNTGIRIEAEAADIFDVNLYRVHTVGFDKAVVAERFYGVTTENCEHAHYRTGYRLNVDYAQTGTNKQSYHFNSFNDRLYGTRNSYAPPANMKGLEARKLTNMKVRDTFNELVRVGYRLKDCDGAVFDGVYSEGWTERLFDLEGSSNTFIRCGRISNTLSATQIILLSFSRLAFEGSNFFMGDGQEVWASKLITQSYSSQLSLRDVGYHAFSDLVEYINGATESGDATADSFCRLAKAQIILKGLPTVNPVVAGQVWNDAGVLKVSSG